MNAYTFRQRGANPLGNPSLHAHSVSKAGAGVTLVVDGAWHCGTRMPPSMPSACRTARMGLPAHLAKRLGSITLLAVVGGHAESGCELDERIRFGGVVQP